MASTTGLARTRSIRKPAVKDDETPQGKPVQGRGETRNASPSRLPMKPPTRSATISTAAPSSTTRTTATTTMTTTQSRARAPTGPAARKTSGNTSTRTSSKSVDHGAPGAVKPLGRAPSIRQAKTATATATAMAPPPAPITRSGSTARPRSSEGGRPAAAAATARERILGHSRAKSTATALTAATTLRPPTHAPSRSNPSPAPSTSSSASATTQTTAASSSTATTTTRAQTRSQTHQQHARVASQSQPAAAAAAPRRPAFNTNQQHYSPARTHAPKALTSTFLAPPSPSKRPANVAATAETSRLQTELLQLSLLHREAPAAAAAWHASARDKLGARFAGLAEAEQALRAAERDAAEARALCDLVRWADARPQQQPTTASSSSSSSLENTATRDGKKKKKTKKSADGDGDGDGDGGGGPPLPLDQKIQLLDQVLNGAWALGGPGGRYQRAVRGFEAWLGAVARIRAAQRSGDVDGLLAPHHCDGNGEDGYGNGNGDRDRDREEIAFFVSDLDADPWRRDHAGLVRVLEGWRRTLAQLGDVIVAEHDDDDDDNNDNDNDNNDDRKKKNNNKSAAAAAAAAKRGARNGGGRKANGGGQPAGNGDGNGVLPTTAAGAPGSSHPGGLARTLRGCRGLVDGMLAELGAMERIERDALAVEEEWMEQMEAQLRADEEDDARRCRARAEDVPPWKLLVS